MGCGMRDAHCVGCTSAQCEITMGSVGMCMMCGVEGGLQDVQCEEHSVINE